VVEIDAAFVSRLVATQFPHWADLPVTPVELDGWDNRSFRLGADMSVRIPRADPYAAQVDKEHRWLPILGPRLPLPIPVPRARGVPAPGCPWHWSVYRWIHGENARIDRIADLRAFATTLADFLARLQRIETRDGPAPGAHNFFRGGPLEKYDAETRNAIAALGGTVDADAATEVWEAALAAVWHGPPVWFHGDVSATNLLVDDGHLNAVIDFGCSGVGDPACDVTIAWTLLSGESREAFRAALPADGATWARGRGWALWKALITIAAHIGSNPAEAASAALVVDAVLADHDRT
jgi:aminoglycoside phosphotransferase (APT) family kinase protein